MVKIGFFLGPIILGASFVLSKELPFCSKGNIKQRPNVHELTLNQLKDFFDAVKKLNQGKKPSKWDNYAKIHIDYQNIHKTPKFLAWHRAFLFKVEQDLQRINPNVMIPYWDWTKTSQNYEKDPVLGSAMFGGKGHSQKGAHTGCIGDGQIKGFQIYDFKRHKSRCLERKTKFNQTAFTNPEEMRHNYLKLPTVDHFGSLLELIPHGSPHDFIGGDFGQMGSPHDPLFMVHHAFIDKLYADWQALHPDLANDYSLPKETIMDPFGISIKDILYPAEKLCYYYKEEHFLWNQQPHKKSHSTPSPVDFEPEPFSLGHFKTNVDKAKFKHEYLLKNITVYNPNDKLYKYKLAITTSLSSEFIKKMNYSEEQILYDTRKNLKITNYYNNLKGYVSEAAPINFEKKRRRFKIFNHFTKH